MIKHLLLVFFIFLVKLNGSTVSLTISEDLINDYLDTVGEYKYYSKRDKSEWIVQNPHVKIQNDEIIFFSKNFQTCGGASFTASLFFPPF